ncbi:MAG: SRPBCC domain-containing protein [Burkholderiales bacterium]|nr:SRPBCC domain-containing protein [Burkholderiales bacterium]
MQQLADLRTTVRISHHYAAPPARVFDAWLAPQIAGLWLFATASRPMVKVDIDARAGGTFCLVERRAGAVIEHRGRYVEIARPQRLMFVLHSPDCAPKEVPLGGAPKEVPLGGAPKEVPLEGVPYATRVTTELKPSDTGCTLQLMHDGLSPQDAPRMEARWDGMFYGLESILALRRAKKTI